VSKFQTVILGIFVVCLVGGVIAFMSYKGTGNSTQLPEISMWGTFSADVFNSYVTMINSKSANSVSVKYRQIKPDQFYLTFITALARRAGPDAVLLPSDLLLPNIDKVMLIPYTALSQRTFLDTYIQEANIYVKTKGTLAIPFTIDPLVMYWNRDMFNAASIATYPKYWDEFTSLAAKLTDHDNDGNIKKSAVAMGDFSNTTNARELLGTLLLQLKNPITKDNEYGELVTTISSSANSTTQSVLKFYTQFVDPSSQNYSWNKGMPNDKTAFLSATVATYFGFASEISELRSKNPNLDFDVAPIPQVRTGGTKATYGRMSGFSVLKSSANTNNAYQVIATLTAPSNIAKLASTMYLPPVRRDLIAQGSTDPYLSVFNSVALTSNTWLDADPIKSRQLFANMVQSITSGKSTISTAIDTMNKQYNVLLRSVTQ